MGDKIQAGDVVLLKSTNSLVMVVGELSTDGKNARCYWYHHGEGPVDPADGIGEEAVTHWLTSFPRPPESDLRNLGNP